MAEKFKKIDREFLLTDDSVNVYGFRLLTSGLQLSEVQANPIGYRMHKRENGVAVRWSDFRTAGDKVYAKPTINLANPLGQQTADEVENGFLNAASVGGIVVLDISEAPDLMLAGQNGPTITKWYPKEISLVDLPGNRNALAPSLYDSDGNEINLTDFIQSTLRKIDFSHGGTKSTESIFNKHLNKKEMEFKNQLIKGLNLSDNTSDEAVSVALQNLIDNAAKVPGLEAARQKAEKNLTDFKAAINQEKIKNLIDAGTKAGKLTAKIAKDLSDKYADDPEGLKNLIDGLPAYQSVTGAIAKNQQAAKSLADKSWDELDKSGKLQDLKDNDLDTFKQKYLDKFGKAYE